MARYRQSERRWVHAASVAGAYLVCVASLFTLQLGTGLNLPISVAVSAPPLVYAALAMLLLRQARFVRRLSWVGAACVVHLVLGVLAATELAWAGGLSFPTALAQVFILFPPAPALTLVAAPLTLAAFGLTAAKPTPRVEAAPPRQMPPAKPLSPPARAGRGVADATRPAAPAAHVATPLGSPATPPPAAAPAAARLAPPAARPPAAAPAPVVSAAPAWPTPASAPAPAVPAAAAPVVAATPMVPAATLPVAAPTPVAPAANGAQKLPRAADDGMVRVPFARIAAQLPAEAFVLPFERLSESLREPHVLLVPRRVVLSQMRDGGVAITWGHIASQFPDLALGMSDDEFRKQYPDLRLMLPIEELASQLPPSPVPPASAPQREWTTAPAVTPPPVVPSPPPRSPTFSPPVPPMSAPPRVELVGREALTRIVACFSGVGSFEAAAERLADSTVVTLVEPGLPREAATASAGRLLPFMAAAPSDVVTVRTDRAVLILAAAALPIVVAARRPGAPVALLSLRALRAAAAGADGAANVAPPPRRALEPVSVEGRVAQAARALRSFGTVEPTVFADGPLRVYVFSGAGGDDKALGALALGVCDALGDGGDLGRLRAVVLRRGAEHTLLRPLAGVAGILAVTGPITRPGRILGDVDRAAAVLETI
jgi:Meckel syndrome type 1 protein